MRFCQFSSTQLMDFVAQLSILTFLKDLITSSYESMDCNKILFYNIQQLGAYIYIIKGETF